MRKTLTALAALALLAVGCSLAPSDKDSGTFAPHNADPTTSQPAAKAPPAKPVETLIKAGSWAVPSEVKPGTYTTVAEGGCYWARLKDFNGELSSIIANGNLDDGQRGRITVKKTDKGLELTGDCTWTVAK